MKNQKKLLKNLSSTVEAFVLGKKYKPFTFEEIAEKLAFPDEHLSYLKLILNDLLKKNMLSLEKNKYIKIEEKTDYLECLLHLNQRGFGFAEIINGDKDIKEDIFIPKTKIKNAIDGDIVEVKVCQKISAKGPEGEIVSVVKRGRSHLAGIVIGKIDKSYQVVAPALGTDKRVELKTDQKLTAGDRIVMKVSLWSSEESDIKTLFSHKIGSIFDPSYDLIAAVEEFEIRNSFSKNLMQEALKFGTKVKKEDLKDRVDLTNLVTITIDPKTAKDFDDALSLSKTKNNEYHLGVHIADVSHYIKKDTLLDDEAYSRANSVYFPEKCIPMLPYELSNGLCSLNPNVIRLCVSVMMVFDADGKLKKYEIIKSYIKSQKRFTYEEAFAVLENKKKSKHKQLLDHMKELCILLKKQRSLRGSIDFSLPDCFIEIKENGDPLSIQTVEYDLSHQLVEEFMLKANEIVAKHLSLSNKAVIYRIHEKPKEEALQDFLSITAQYGFKVSKDPTKKELQQLFEKIKVSPFFKDISIAFIRSMKLAAYSSKNIGHYGLSLDYYCHFTSPIRRYSDLVIHRTLFSNTMEAEKIDLIANHCSNQERKAMKAENSVIYLKKLRLLAKKLKSDPQHIFNATITKIKPFAIYFDLSDYFLEDSIVLNELKHDYFTYLDKQNILVGKYTNIKYKVSDQIFLKLKNVDLVLQSTKWKILKNSH